jgi:alpha-tubulin suppressor-like RCC1 family protein
VDKLRSGVSTVSVGSDSACALTVGGAVVCWGDDSDGELGDGKTGFGGPTPTQVVGLSSGVVALAAGSGQVEYHACAVLDDGSVKCWGDASGGRLGTTQGLTYCDSYPCALTPVNVTGLAGPATSISSGGGTTCVILKGGAVQCWGVNQGMLGDGSTVEYSSSPVQAKGLTSGVTAISVGLVSVCAIDSGGRVQCWGKNKWGGLGDGTTTDSGTPVEVKGLTSAVAISVGYGSACAITSNGGVSCWGAVPGMSTNTSTPIPMPDLQSGISVVSVGMNGTACVVREDGRLQCWGVNFSGILGNGSTTGQAMTPVDVKGL